MPIACAAGWLRCIITALDCNLVIMQRRILVLPIAAVIIVTMCAYKLLRDEKQRAVTAKAVTRPVTPFELFDCDSPQKRVRLASYLGRHPILLVFFDGELGANRDPQLKWVTQNAEQIEEADIYVFAVSGALAYKNRAALKQMAVDHLAKRLQLLTDPPSTPSAPRMGYLVHRQWGRYDEQILRPLQGIFLIDRAGRVLWDENGPVAVTLDDPKLQQFLVDQ